MDEQILLSDYSEVTEIITMVGGGDDGTRLLLSFCPLLTPLQLLLAYANQPKHLLPVEIIMRLSLEHSCGCKKTQGGIIKVKHDSLKKFRCLMHAISFHGFCQADIIEQWSNNLYC
jgi:hypothetical protein